MQQIEAIKEIIEKHKPEICAKYRVSEIGVFHRSIVRSR
jgi:predicted nucleotidyltransferase